ncbi:MAG: AbrB/MazE/SpoVT family DNA-binding domain-containing protein [Alphaproteobacteria bacterium]|jgi:putative addiction module antidote|nr:AbrB/MazE/SpoVT family DNA-binding domain-containing protein [Alphaproteobacteria bacterium]MBK9586645.1 AbrB/MazE/SpoVT family DNA-binding domain-containing protein [Alphaproteobacteria bacterium]MBP7759388.1 AbrB/MazE/SpoVT family DNA-binding domain-containing protein [Alphaproteobacteria bacterium]MBP7762665.1 AbrB/MazE/SpoVT family DNA-binding domain-containing protein [Alphaproteobacteria bacterium]QQS57044.1 MAG: AbrB/MazE/SpoVT family DNA-binding domain-containing protein [Alphaproteo
MELKITKIGNSLGVVLPKEVLTHLNLEKGDALWLRETSEGVTLSPYDPSFAEQMDAARKLMKKRRNALRELAK